MYFFVVAYKASCQTLTRTDRTITDPVDPVLGHHLFQENQPAPMPELPKEQPHQPPKDSQAEDHTEVASGEDHC